MSNLEPAAMASDFTAAPDPVNYDIGLPSVDQIYSRLYPSSDVIAGGLPGMDRDIDDVGSLGALGGQDRDPDDL